MTVLPAVLPPVTDTVFSLFCTLIPNGSAEHGCFLKTRVDPEWLNMMEQDDLQWKAKVVEIFDYYTERTSGSFVEHKVTPA